MPKELTHWMLAQRALGGLPAGSHLGALIAQHREAYLGGAVLPDTLAHLFRGPYHLEACNLGQRFHDARGNSYQPLIDAEALFPDGMPPALFSCFLGVVSHVEADIALHPYVYAQAGDADIGEHYRLETALDLRLLRRGGAPAQQRLDRILGASSRELLVSALALLFDPEGKLPRQALERSLTLHCRFQSMYDRAFWKLAVRLLARLCGSPFREQRHLFYPLGKGKEVKHEAGQGNRWRHPETGEMESASPEDLARRAVERTVSLFLRIETAGTLAAALSAPAGANLLTGLPGVGKRNF